MYLSRNSSSYAQRRGGFSLFADNQPQGVSGLGDLYSDLGITSTLTQNSTMQSMATSATSLWDQIPKSLVYLTGGIIAFAFLLPSGRR